MRLDIESQKENIIQWIKEGLSKKEMASRLNCNKETLNNYLIKFGIDYRGKQDWLKGGTYESKSYMPFDEYVNRSNVNINTNKLRIKLLREGLKEAKCERCGNTEWEGQPIPLEVHHIDGDRTKNSLDNLQLLCPNCHALTPTYRGKNIKKKICRCGEIGETQGT